MDISIIPIFDDNYVFHILTEDGLSVVIDPGDAQPVIDFLNRHELPLHIILHTHHHWDHIDGDPLLQEKYGCEIWGPEHEILRILHMNVFLENEQEYTLGTDSFKVIHTPGHTRGHIALYFEKHQVLFSGDTLFSLGCGRLFEGTPTQMWDSLKKIRALPDQTQIYCAHEYTLDNARFWKSIEPENPKLSKTIEDILEKRKKNISTTPTTIAFEKDRNPFLRADDPQLAYALKKDGQTPEEIFAYIRKLKDNF